MEEVECGECGNRYDSDVQPFCPRCGNAGVRKVAGKVSAVRFDPRRRRAQVGGLVLIVTAATMLALYGVVLATAGSLVEGQSLDLLQDQPGGDVVVSLDGLDANTTIGFIEDRSGTLLANLTFDADGEASAMDLSAAAVNVTVTSGNTTWHREVLTLQGTNVVVPLSPDAPLEGKVGTDVLVGPVRIMLGFFMLISLFVVLGGVSAMRLRNRNVALGAAIIGLIPVLILAMAVPNIGTMLLLITMGLALMFIIGGRQHFE